MIGGWTSESRKLSSYLLFRSSPKRAAFQAALFEGFGPGRFLGPSALCSIRITPRLLKCLARKHEDAPVVCGPQIAHTC